MERFCFKTVLIFMLLISSVVHAEDKTDFVSTVNIYGSEWGNIWSGGVLFKLKTMPSGVSYFTVRKDDLAFDAFFSTLLFAKASEKKLIVKYDSASTDGNGYTAVKFIAIP